MKLSGLLIALSSVVIWIWNFFWFSLWVFRVPLELNSTEHVLQSIAAAVPAWMHQQSLTRFKHCEWFQLESQMNFKPIQGAWKLVFGCQHPIRHCAYQKMFGSTFLPHRWAQRAEFYHLRVRSHVSHEFQLLGSQIKKLQFST